MPLKPSHWASLVPRNPAEQKPNHYLEMARVAWENRDQLPFAWRILEPGHVRRLRAGHDRAARLDARRRPPVHGPARADAPQHHARPRSRRGWPTCPRCGALRSKELRALGRLPEPMIRRKGEPGFRVVSWEEAYAAAAEKIRAAPPERFAVYVTSRGILNEHYYAAQKAARAMGTNHVDNSARLCHAASTVAMKRTVGYGATTCSYTDWIGTDLIVFFGSNTPNNQPVTMKYLYHARRQGAKVAVVNTYFEPGPQAVLGAVGAGVGGVRHEVRRRLVPRRHRRRPRVPERRAQGARRPRTGSTATSSRAAPPGSRRRRAHVAAQDWETLEAESGTTRAEMRRFAEMLRAARNGIFVWSMGLTQHAHGVDTIQALMNVGLARGWVGREKVGMMPIRGHSGVQGGAEVGCAPGLEEPHSTRFAAGLGLPLPAFKGLTASEMVDAAYRGALDVFWIVGGNFLETLPDPAAVARAWPAWARASTRTSCATSMMLLDPADTVVLFPATTRYESPGGGTETSTERRIIFSPEVPGRRIGSAKPEWEVFGEVAARVRPDRADKVRFASSQQIRDEIAPRGAAVRGHRAAEGAGRPVPVGRAAALRRRRLQHAGRQGALHRRHPAATPGARGDVLRLDPAREAVQLHGAARDRPADRRARATTC